MSRRSFKFEYLGEINFAFEINLGMNQGTGRVPLMKGPKSRATVHLIKDFATVNNTSQGNYVVPSKVLRVLQQVTMPIDNFNISVS